MANDFRTIITADNSQFVNSVNKAERSFSKFTNKCEKDGASFGKLDGVFKSVGGSVAKFAGGLGIALTAGESFNKAMRSVQTTSDLLDNNINAAKDTVDAFFKSLTSGDWNVFNDGVLTTFRNLRDLSTMMDELADKKLSLSFIRTEDMRDIERFEQIAKDTSKGQGLRIDAAQNMQGVINHLNKKTKETIDYQMDVLNKQYASKSGLKIDTKDLEYFVKNTNFSGDLTSQANDAYKTFLKLSDEAEKLKANAIYDIKNYGVDETRSYQKSYQDAKEALKVFAEQNDFLIKQGWLTEENDAARQQTVNTLIEQLNLEKEIYSLQKRADETMRGVQTSVSPKQPGTDKPLKGSIDYINAQISSLTKKLNAATDEATRQGIRAAIEKLKDEKLKIEMESLPEGSIDYLNAQIPILTKKLNTETDEAARQGIRAAIEKINKEKYKIELEATLGRLKPMEGDKFSVSAKGRNATEDIKSGYISVKGVSSDAIKSNYEYADSLGAIGNMMSSVSRLTNEGAASWLDYSLNVMQAVGQALPALNALFNKNVAAAGSSAVLGAASSGPLGWLTAGAAVASIVAAIAAIPKFANGGIVPGSLYSGDRVPAMVNSGEMILNRSQQGRLFDILNSKGGVNGKDVRVTGEVVVSGEQMRILLANTDRKLRRGR